MHSLAVVMLLAYVSCLWGARVDLEGQRKAPGTFLGTFWKPGYPSRFAAMNASIDDLGISTRALLRSCSGRP